MKPGAFTKMYVHLVLAVKGRENVLSKSIQPRIYEYMSGIITGLKHKSIIINGFTNHVHILFGLNPNKSVSDTVHEVKRCSSIFINGNKLLPGRFSWQDCYGAFTYSRSDIENVYGYIENQESHHAKKSFREEFLSILEMNDVDYDPRFLFEFFDDLP